MGNMEEKEFTADMIKSVEYTVQLLGRFTISSRAEMIIFCVSGTSTFYIASFYYSQEVLIWVQL